jgi:hypothetical protein
MGDDDDRGTFAKTLCFEMQPHATTYLLLLSPHGKTTHAWGTGSALHPHAIYSI